MAEVEKKIGEALQGDIPLVKRPFRILGEKTGRDEEAVVGVVRMLLKEGTIRKFGAVLRHQKAGFRWNAMVIWAVPENRVEQTGTRLKSFKEVTHCYERRPAFDGKYNLFTMVHIQGEDPGREIRSIASATGIEDYRILESVEEFKKSSMEYF